MLAGALPALLTFLIRLFVPESERWQHEQDKGQTSNWAARDLLGVGIGAAAAIFIIYLWADEFRWAIRLPGTLVALVVVTLGYLYPAMRYMQRSSGNDWRPTVRLMFLGACLSGVALLGTWASMQWAPAWADKLTGGKIPEAKAYTQIWMSLGAILGTIVAALLGGW